jgi:hypothetical protein
LFWGYLRCTECGYRTEDFMCGPHWHSWSHGVLIQEAQSQALRVFWIPVDDAPDRSRFQTKDEEGQAFEKYTAHAVAGELQPGERHVEVREFMFDDRPTALPCPHCQQLLRWEFTGIS